MAGLRRLTGDDEHPQERVVLLDSNMARPTVEVTTGAPTVVHVVEPVATPSERFGFDELTDVENTLPPGTPFVLREGPDGVYRAVLPTIQPPDPDSVRALARDVVEVHEQAPEPHPAYDDLPSLRLIFENGLI